MELFRSSYGKAVGTILKNGITEADGISANKPEKLIISTVSGLGLPQLLTETASKVATADWLRKRDEDSSDYPFINPNFINANWWAAMFCSTILWSDYNSPRYFRTTNDWLLLAVLLRTTALYFIILRGP